jgi:hypothetical protein
MVVPVATARHGRMRKPGLERGVRSNVITAVLDPGCVETFAVLVW